MDNDDGKKNCVKIEEQRELEEIPCEIKRCIECLGVASRL